MTLTMRHRMLKAVSAIVILGASCVFLYSATSLMLHAAGSGEKQVFVRPRMVLLPAKAGDDFWMGSPEDEAGRDGDETRHQVRLASAFAISETEVTIGQFEAVMGYNPVVRNRDKCTLWDEDPPKTEDYPVYCVSFLEAARYANRLTELEFPKEDARGASVSPCYDGIDEDSKKITWPEKHTCRGYRLPTEAEWEYAARARDRWRLFAGTDVRDRLCEFANVPGCPGQDGLRPVGERSHNSWGLYDMSGNVREWTWDRYGAYPSGVMSDDRGGADSGSGRVIRGGSWGYAPRYARVSNRGGWSPEARYGNLGFRLSRSFP